MEACSVFNVECDVLFKDVKSGTRRHLDNLFATRTDDFSQTSLTMRQ
jgi:hypothetical protein